MSDVLVIGAGLAGLTAALRLREQGATVTLATFGVGGLPLSPGTLDVLGYAPDRVGDPFAVMGSLDPSHPYALIGADAVRAGVDAVVRWSEGVLVSSVAEPHFSVAGPHFSVAGPHFAVAEPVEATSRGFASSPFDKLRDREGDKLRDREAGNKLVPTAVGALRPTWVTPSTMTADVAHAESVAVVGIRQLRDFHAALIAGNLARSCAGSVRHTEIDFLARGGEPDQTSLTIARMLDDPDPRERFVRALADVVRPGECVVLPAVLGMRPETAAAIQEAVGTELVEVPMLPPSVPGIRLNDLLVSRLRAARVRWILGSRVTGRVVDGRVTDLTLHASGASKKLRASTVVLATGGFESGGLQYADDGTLTESVLNLPVWAPDGDQICPDLPASKQPLFSAGVRVDEHMRPVVDGAPIEHLYAVGGLLAGANRWQEMSGEGIAVGSAVKACEHILRGRS